MEEDTFYNNRLNDKEIWELVRLEDQLYSEGFSKEGVNLIIRNKEAKILGRKMQEKAPSLKKIVLGCALGVALAIGFSYLAQNCSYFDSMRKDDFQYQHPNKRGNLNKPSQGGYGVE